MMYESMVTMDWDTSEVYGNVVVPSANEDGTEFHLPIAGGHALVRRRARDHGRRAVYLERFCQ